MARASLSSAMRRLIVLLAFLAGCATSTNAADAGADMSVGQCDRKQLFSSCSQQCGFHVCGIGVVSCDAGQWKCDCTQAVPCASSDGGHHD
jgi:hypothetical protein